MIRIDDKTYRNIQEQVEKNKNDIEDIIKTSQVLNQFGIKVVGQVTTPQLVPDPLTYQGNYGDAYLVGTETPYDMYIYTRPTQAITTNHWLNIGEFPLPGPEGPTGPQGEVGPRGLTGPGWIFATTTPSVEEYAAGTLWLNGSTFDIYVLQLNDPLPKYWARVGNIQGPQGAQGAQGIQGPQGEAGPQGEQGIPGTPGRVFHIVAQIESTQDLPDPTLMVDTTAAYLVGQAAPYELYVIIGDIPENYEWQNTGSLTGGSKVYVGGELVEQFNADTKLNKVNGTTDYPQVYLKNANGTQTMYNVASTLASWSVPLRNGQNEIIVGTPTSDNAAANKKYVDDSVAKKLDKIENVTINSQLYAKNINGEQIMINFDYFNVGSPTSSSNIVQRMFNGHLSVVTPTQDKHCVNKKYVDDLTGKIIRLSGSSGTLTGAQISQIANFPLSTYITIGNLLFKQNSIVGVSGDILTFNSIFMDEEGNFVICLIVIDINDYSWSLVTKTIE